MGVYILNAQDMWTLTVLSGFEISEDSPLAMLDEKAPEFAEKKRMKESVKRLIDQGFLWPRKDTKRFDVNMNVLPALKVMMEPEEKLTFYFARYVEAKNYYFLKRSKTIVQYIISSNFEFHIFSYPWNTEMLRNWVQLEIEDRVVSPAGAGQDENIVLSIDETVILMATQQILRYRVENKGPLSEGEDWISNSEIWKFLKEGEITNFVSFFRWGGIAESVEAILDSSNRGERFYKALYGLVNKGLLETMDVSGEVNYRYTYLAKQILDPGLIVDYGLLSYKRVRNGKTSEEGCGLFFHKDKILVTVTNPEKGSVEILILSPQEALRFMEEKFPKGADWKEPSMPEFTVRRQAAPLCPKCGRPLAYIKQYNRYYCYQCQEYQ